MTVVTETQQKDAVDVPAEFPAAKRARLLEQTACVRLRDSVLFASAFKQFGRRVDGGKDACCVINAVARAREKSMRPGTGPEKAGEAA